MFGKTFFFFLGFKSINETLTGKGRWVCSSEDALRGQACARPIFGGAGLALKPTGAFPGARRAGVAPAGPRVFSWTHTPRQYSMDYKDPEVPSSSA